MSSIRLLVLAIVLLLAASSIDSAPFFDALYDAINGNGRRSYGYSGYGNPSYGYQNQYPGYGYNGYNGYGNVERHPRKQADKSWKDICKVHFPDSISGVPGRSGVVCPY